MSSQPSNHDPNQQGFIPDDARRGDYTLGVISSSLGHLVFAYFMFVAVEASPVEFDQVVYSVTIEGGKTLGGVQQVPKEDAKSEPAVPRNVSEPEKKNEQVPEIETEEQPDPAEVANPDEVSLATPVPTAAPTIKPTARPSAKPTVPAKATARPTAKVPPTPRPPTRAETNREFQATMKKYLGESTDAGGSGHGAARTGGTGMGGGVLRPPEFFRYRDLLEAFVKSGWRWIDPRARLSAAVVFDISPEGTVSGVRIEKSSGNREFDESVLRAVYKANPVPRPPPSVYESYFRSVRMIFEPQ